MWSVILFSLSRMHSRLIRVVTYMYVIAAFHVTAGQYSVVRTGHILVICHLLVAEAWCLRFGQVPKGSTGQHWDHTSEQPPAGHPSFSGQSLGGKAPAGPGPSGVTCDQVRWVAAFLEGAMTPTSSAPHSGFWERRQWPSREGPGGLTGATGAPGHWVPSVFQHPQCHAEVPGGPG